jgi:hypothetical protein
VRQLANTSPAPFTACWRDKSVLPVADVAVAERELHTILTGSKGTWRYIVVHVSGAGCAGWNDRCEGSRRSRCEEGLRWEFC